MIYRINGKQVTKEQFHANSKGWDYSTAGNLQVGSFKPFVSPIDWKPINNSNELSAHNRRHGVQQVGHQFEGIVAEGKARSREREMAKLKQE